MDETDKPRESSKQAVERIFPNAKGRQKAALILAHGAGFDAGMACAEEVIIPAFVEMAEFMRRFPVKSEPTQAERKLNLRS